jgi:hypothetical protein
MANNLRVYATVGESNIYSVKKLTGEYTDRTTYSFKWSILNNTANETYGSIIGANTNEFVEVIWKRPAQNEQPPYTDRVLICEVEKLDTNGNVIGCYEALRLSVSLTVPTLDLNLEYFKGINDGDIVNINTGEIRFKDQCHIQDNVMQFTVKGNANTKYIRVELKNKSDSSFVSSFSNGIFLESSDPTSNVLADNQVGFYEYDVSQKNGIANVFIKFFEKPFPDGFYWVRAYALDNFRNYSEPLYLKFKLLRDGVTIQLSPTSTYKSEIILGEAAMNFKYQYTLVHEIPSWFKIDSYYEVGQINCIGCNNVEDESNYIGEHWRNGESNRISLDSATVSGITLEDQQYYTVSTSLTFPDVFVPQQSWQPGTSPDHFKVKIFGKIYDPDNETSCYALKDNIQSQTVKISYCNTFVEYDGNRTFEAPKCPDPPQYNNNRSFVPQITIACPPEKTFNRNSGTCVWNFGATGPCNNISNMSWNGSTCVCQTGYHFDLVNNQCISDIVNCYGITSISSMTTTCQSLKCLETGIGDSRLYCVGNNAHYYQDIRNYWEKNGYYYEYTGMDLDLHFDEQYIKTGDVIYFCKTNSMFYDISDPFKLPSETYYGHSGKSYLNTDVKYRIGQLRL